MEKPCKKLESKNEIFKSIEVSQSFIIDIPSDLYAYQLLVKNEKPKRNSATKKFYPFKLLKSINKVRSIHSYGKMSLSSYKKPKIVDLYLDIERLNNLALAFFCLALFILSGLVYPE